MAARQSRFKNQEARQASTTRSFGRTLNCKQTTHKSCKTGWLMTHFSRTSSGTRTTCRSKRIAKTKSTISTTRTTKCLLITWRLCGPRTMHSWRRSDCNSRSRCLSNKESSHVMCECNITQSFKAKWSKIARLNNLKAKRSKHWAKFRIIGIACLQTRTVDHVSKAKYSSKSTEDSLMTSDKLLRTLKRASKNLLMSTH